MTQTQHQLDVRGEMCPYPATKTRETLAGYEGDVLVVLTDHAPALSTVPWEGAKAGYEATIEESGRGEWAITLTRADGPLDKQAALQRIADQVSRFTG